jgi:SHS2 domain-containing protein
MEMLPLFLYNGLRGMKKTFEIIDHTADVGIIAYGVDVEELFSNAALAMFSLITEPESVEEKLHLDLQVSSEDRDSLLVEWLNELIYLFDVKHILFNRFDIESLTHNELKATCYGEGFDPMKHKIKIGVKAATYHMLKLDKSGDGCKAQIILDI